VRIERDKGRLQRRVCLPREALLLAALFDVRDRSLDLGFRRTLHVEVERRLDVQTRAIDTPYSAARTGATRACKSCSYFPHDQTSIVGTINACAPSRMNAPITRA
jgi:hypothetical protein